jgi:RsiW-degrading membrane proteinase PrsW (M82 family)
MAGDRFPAGQGGIINRMEISQVILMILPVVLPAMFWAIYHYRKDHNLPEPLGHLALAFGLGVVAYYLAGLMYQALGFFGLRMDAWALAETNLPGLFLYAVLGIGVIEESAKMLLYVLVIIRFREFNEPIDGIIYASFIALGFALVENLNYLQFLTAKEALGRGFAGPVVHIVFASIWGYYIGRAWLCGKKLLPILLAALAFTAFLHGVYDFIVIALPPPALAITAVLITGLWVWRLSLIRDLHTLRPGPCPPGLHGDED